MSKPDPQTNSQITTTPTPNPGEEVDDTVYESAFKPLMWLLIPFILVIIYGAMT